MSVYLSEAFVEDEPTAVAKKRPARSFDRVERVVLIMAVCSVGFSLVGGSGRRPESDASGPAGVEVVGVSRPSQVRRAVVNNVPLVSTVHAP